MRTKTKWKGYCITADIEPGEEGPYVIILRIALWDQPEMFVPIRYFSIRLWDELKEVVLDAARAREGG